jgi:hypothetical protein
MAVTPGEAEEGDVIAVATVRPAVPTTYGTSRFMLPDCVLYSSRGNPWKAGGERRTGFLQ